MPLVYFPGVAVRQLMHPSDGQGSANEPFALIPGDCRSATTPRLRRLDPVGREVGRVFRLRGACPDVKRLSMTSRLINRNVWPLSGRTSMRLEPEFWGALEKVAKATERSLNEVIDAARRAYPEGGLASAVRVYLLEWFGRAAEERRAERPRRAGEGR